MIFVTGGAGFIGSNFIHNWLAKNDESVLNIDKLTYAGNLESLRGVSDSPNYKFAQVDIVHQEQFAELLNKHRPRAVLNFAAESHVDRSIHGPRTFIETNVVGTFSLLQASREYWEKLLGKEKSAFRFLHVSTDEVYGSLGPEDAAFTETTSFSPNSPYSASKASSNHLVRAYHHTYGLPVFTTNCSNNYGPFQFLEKLIPLVIHNALSGKPLPIYGNGMNVRDWLYVTDHCDALEVVLEKGVIGEVYNIGGWNEKTNIEVVTTICESLDRRRPRADGKRYHEQIIHIEDRPGHDKRYAIDASKIEVELGWRPKETFQTGLEKTLDWYLSNETWTSNVASGQYREWMSKNYGGTI